MKFNPEGSVDRLKAQLVAKGHTQTYDIDFEETFSTVANISSIHVLISLVVKLDRLLFQMFRMHFYIGTYLKGFKWINQCLLLKGSVWKLKNALYGQKQSQRARFGKF